MKKEIALMTPVSKDLLYVKIADAIHGYIRENNLKPGDRLPSERALSQQLGTGRHSVREALRVLENQGIIEVRMGAGTFVAEETQDNSLYMEFVKINYMEMLNIKVELEKYAVKLSMKKLEEKAVHIPFSRVSLMEALEPERELRKRALQILFNCYHTNYFLFSRFNCNFGCSFFSCIYFPVGTAIGYFICTCYRIQNRFKSIFLSFFQSYFSCYSCNLRGCNFFLYCYSNLYR